MESTSEPLQNFCHDLLDGLLDETLTVEAAREHLDRMLYLLDKTPKVLEKNFPQDFKRKCAFLKREIAKVFNEWY